MKRSLVVTLRWGPQVLFGLVIALLAYQVIRYLATDEALLLPDRLNLVSVISTVALVLITAFYVRITAQTLAHLREERISAAEPHLYLTVKTVGLDPENRIQLALENFGRGPAIKLQGEYRCRSAQLHGQWLRHQLEPLPTSLPVGVEHSAGIQLTDDDLGPLTGERYDGFLVVRLVYEDARRNLYVYRLSLSLLRHANRRYVQEYSEKLWRIPAGERSYIFDNANLALVLEAGRRPLFARGLLLPDEDT
jgi:hypothetical protein